MCRPSGWHAPAALETKTDEFTPFTNAKNIHIRSALPSQYD
jgi:hypothetical protein